MPASPIEFVNGHIQHPPDYAWPIVQAVGLAAFNWGRLEQQLDTLLISINKEHFSSRKFRPTPNTSFKLKLDLFKEWCGKDPRFSVYHDRARKLTKALKSLSLDRAILFHSNFQRFSEGPPPKMHVVNVHIEGENVKVSRAEWTKEQVLGFAVDCSRFNLGLWTITKEVLTPDFLKSLETE